jgi:hypothetical protein
LTGARNKKVKQYIVRLESGQYVANYRIESGDMTYDTTDSPANATRFFDFGSKLVVKWLAEKGEKARREEVEGDAR